MKWPLLLGGLVVSGTVAGSLFLGDDAPKAAADRSGTPAPEVTREKGSASSRGVSSPKNIVTGNFSSPEQIKASFKKQGKDWPTKNLVTFPNGNRADCPGGSGGAPENTLYIRYVTDYPQNSGGQPSMAYTDLMVPLPNGGTFEFQTPDITEKIIRDDYEWKRTYVTKWWSGVDKNWARDLRAEQDRLKAEFMRAQEESPTTAYQLAQRIAQIQQDLRQNPVNALNEETSDIVEVEAPSTAWSFKYDNRTKKGDPLYRRDKKTDYAAHADQLLENAEELVSILDPIRQFGEDIENGGTRTILGYECTVQRASGWDAEACMADIDGQRVSLWTRIDKAHKTAVHIDPSPCVPLAQFMPPPDVDFAEEW